MTSWTRFLLCVAAICVGGYAALYAFALSPGYCAVSKSLADSAPCYQYGVKNKAVDILLVGDSSLLYGVSPAIVQRETGISTYNYGLVGPAFSFDPQAVIDRFLADNPRPRAVVVYMSPSNRIVRHRITDRQWFPLALLTLRHGNFHDFVRLFWARPSALVEIPPTLLASTGLSTEGPRERRAQMQRDGGRLDYGGALTAANGALPRGCRAADFKPVPDYAPDNRAPLAALRTHFLAQGLPLYVLIAPTAECDGKLGEVRAAYAGIADSVPVALPDRLFANDTPVAYHVHVNAAGVPVVSARLGAFVAQLPPVRRR